jgi:hypothetical protein
MERQILDFDHLAGEFGLQIIKTFFYLGQNEFTVFIQFGFAAPFSEKILILPAAQSGKICPLTRHLPSTKFRRKSIS